jgi:hypothetical protein
MPNSDDDLLGVLPQEKPKRGGGRPTNEAVAARESERRAQIEESLRGSQFAKQGKSALGDPYSIQAGVNITWLCQAFRQDIKTVRRKLADLDPIGVGARKMEIYDFPAAASRLAKPLPDAMAQFIRGMRVQDLPIQLQHPYWSAMRVRQIYEEHAGQLWKTDDVLEVFADTFKTIKSQMQLWVDDVDSNQELTNDQRILLGQMVDGLQDDIHARLVEMPKLKQTRSSAEAPDMKSMKIDLAEDDADVIG